MRPSDWAAALFDKALSRWRRRAGPKLPARAMPGVVLLTVLMVGLVSSLWTLLATHDPELTRIGWGGAVRGALTAQTGKTLLHHNPFAASLVTADRLANYVLFGDLGPGVMQGCPGRLFLPDEFLIYPDRAANFAANMHMIEATAGFLAQRGIALIIVPVPDKSRVEAGALCGLKRPAVLGDRFDRIVEALRRSGVKVVDILPMLHALGGDAFYRTDTHWNERGARRAAETVASRMGAWGLVPRRQTRFEIVTGPSHERLGDLIHLAGLAGFPPPFRPAGDITTISDVEQIGPKDDAEPDTVLLGTSFSNMSNFAAFLGMALSAPIDNRAESGGAINGSPRAYFTSPAFTQSPPRIIVWEIPERFIEAPFPKADRNWIKALGASGGKHWAGKGSE